MPNSKVSMRASIEAVHGDRLRASCPTFELRLIRFIQCGRMEGTAAIGSVSTGHSDKDSLVASFVSELAPEAPVTPVTAPADLAMLAAGLPPGAVGWAVAIGAGICVALDLELTDDLRSAGLAREVVRFIQDARKNSGLDISDRIELWWQADDEPLASALHKHRDSIAGEVLAVSVAQGRPNADISPRREPELGLTVWLRAAGG